MEKSEIWVENPIESAKKIEAMVTGKESEIAAQEHTNEERQHYSWERPWPEIKE